MQPNKKPLSFPFRVLLFAFHAFIFLFGSQAAADDVQLDKDAWELFIYLVSRTSTSNTRFETWASNADTFIVEPVFPSGPTPVELQRPLLSATRSREIVGRHPAIGEETRRSQASFDFIVQNRLYTLSGLRKAYGARLAFPDDAIEMKGSWIPISELSAFVGRKMTQPDLKNFYVRQGADAQEYALIAIHIMAKQSPNWIWATFEHQESPGRCDAIGCRDAFGAKLALVRPAALENTSYGECRKSSPLRELFSTQNVDPTFMNYCLKGVQNDYVNDKGVATRLGNSVTEAGFVDQSSCITCHRRAGFIESGLPASTSNRDVGALAPIGYPDPSWFFAVERSPISPSTATVHRVATPADFSWSVVLCAIDVSKTDAHSRCNRHKNARSESISSQSVRVDK